MVNCCHRLLHKVILSEKTAGRRAGRRSGPFISTRRRVNLQTNAVRVFKKDSTRFCPLGVRDYPIVKKRYLQPSKPLLGLLHIFYGSYLEREVVEARSLLVKTTFTLLPECQDQLLILTQKGESTAVFLRFAHNFKPEHLLVELLRTVQVADIQSNVACL